MAEPNCISAPRETNTNANTETETQKKGNEMKGRMERKQSTKRKASKGNSKANTEAPTLKCKTPTPTPPNRCRKLQRSPKIAQIKKKRTFVLFNTLHPISSFQHLRNFIPTLPHILSTLGERNRPLSFL
ncbi:hypothetical protein DXG01_003330, partial [Tephrocybe rancida]